MWSAFNCSKRVTRLPKARDRYPIDPTEPTLVCDVTKLRFMNYDLKIGARVTIIIIRNDADFAHPVQRKISIFRAYRDHVTGIPSTPWDPRKPRLGLRFSFVERKYTFTWSPETSNSLNIVRIESPCRLNRNPKVSNSYAEMLPLLSSSRRSNTVLECR